jgi:hypothetical protein
MDIFFIFAAMKKASFLILMFLFGKRIYAQENIEAEKIDKSIFSKELSRDFSRRGQWYLHWGWNFSWYTKSDINFKGPGYDFTLKNVTAKDRPSKLSSDYINPMELTTPQFDFRFGYFIKDNYSISIGWDHMKYVMNIPQKVIIDGHIGASVSNPGIPTGEYAGDYQNQELEVKSDMLTFEHTDGLNYVSAEIERYDDIWIAKIKKQLLTMETGLGAGFVIPRSDVRLFGVGENNFWNFAGYGLSVKAGLKFNVTKTLYFQNVTKAGYIDLDKIHTTGRNAIDGAKQNIHFLENYTAIGVQF